MNNSFTKFFTRQPDEIRSGDYFYRILWIEAEQQKYHLWVSTENELAEKEEYNRINFLTHLKERTFSGTLDESRDDFWLREVKQDRENSKVYKIFSENAKTNTPVMDFCTSDYMGLLPYLLELNPHLPCLAQDVDVNVLHRLRRRFDENLPDAVVSFASFDNLDMPLHDNSVPCVTRSGFVTHCSMNRNFDHNPDLTLEENHENFRKFTENLKQIAVNEVYRILKPSGLLILEDGDETEFEYDINQIDAFFEVGELLYVLNSRKKVMKILADVEEEKRKTVSLEKKLLSAVFEKVLIEPEKWYLPPSETASLFSTTGDPIQLPTHTLGENLIISFGKVALFILRKPTDVK